MFGKIVFMILASSEAESGTDEPRYILSQVKADRKFDRSRNAACCEAAEKNEIEGFGN